jgi:hypothetical protein
MRLRVQVVIEPDEDEANSDRQLAAHLARDLADHIGELAVVQFGPFERLHASVYLSVVRSATSCGF